MVAPRKTRVLVLAEACNPTWTSVPLVGYQFARSLARRPDLAVEVVTHERNRAGLAGDELTRLAPVHFIDSDAVGGPLYRLSVTVRGGAGLAWTVRTAAAWPAYVLFEHLVHRRFGGRLAQGEFDLIHRVTPLTPSFGSPLVGLTDVPVVLGPLNGGLPWPDGFDHLRRAEGEWLAPFRGLHRLLPYHRSTLSRAAGVIAASRHTATEVGRGRGLRAFLPENGVDPGRFPLADGWPEPAGRFRFVTVGRFVPCKSFDLILDALAGSAALRNAELVVVGDGPLKADWQARADRLGLGDRVSFPGWVPNTELRAILRSSQAFVFPSVREFGGGVVLEAMASGLPCVVADYGGPAELIDETCGVAVPLGSRDEMVGRLRTVMEGLAAEPDRCRRMGHAAVERVRAEFTWDAKAGWLADLYRSVLAGRSGSASSSPLPSGERGEE